MVQSVEVRNNDIENHVFLPSRYLLCGGIASSVSLVGESEMFRRKDAYPRCLIKPATR